MYLPIIIIIIQIFINLVDGSCDPQTCNGLKIKPPFWIPIPQQSDCGPPGFNITCNHDEPLINIHGDNFIVRNIFYTNSSFLLARYRTADAISCPVPRHNFSVDGTPFSYGPSTTDLYFLYNCTAPYDKQTYPVDCGSNATRRYSFAVFHVELLRHWNYSISSCDALVTSPVLEGPIDQLLKMNYSVVLDDGFVLQWNGNHRGGYKLNLGLKIGIGVGASVLSSIAMCIIFSVYHHRYKTRYATATATASSSQTSHEFSHLEKDLEKAGVHIFKYKGLEEATCHFDPKAELGDGGYGAVYKGKLKDGRTVAVKKLYHHHLRRFEHFLNEVEILTRLRHKNLVSLYGCTSCHSAELLLVYEYVPNGTVSDHLYGLRPPLSWPTRLSIAVETASALAYLHASCVIHRDVKSSNILLDDNFVVKVADFGLSRFLPSDVTHVSTGPQGTPGYVDPEYNEYYQVTEKSDVYSFGVVLIELVSSKPAVDIGRKRSEINLATMAVDRIRNGGLGDLVDPGLGFGSDHRVRGMVSDVAELAFRCLQNGREMRPRMQQVLEVLEEIQRTNYSIHGNGNENENDAHSADKE